jgi:hypothetical protein
MYCKSAEAFLYQRKVLQTQIFLVLPLETRWMYDQIMQKVNKINREKTSISMKMTLLSAKYRSDAKAMFYL